MITNIIDAYFKYNKNNILIYNEMCLKYLDIEGVLLEKNIVEVFDKIIYEYFTKKYSNDTKPEVINIDLEILLSSLKTKQPDLDLLLSVLIQHINVNKFEDNVDLVHLYRILSNSILIAIELNQWTCSIAKGDNSFKEVISKILDKYDKYFEPDVIKMLKKPIPLLKEQYIARKKIMDKLIQHYDNQKIDFEGYEILNTYNQNKWFQVNLKYNFEKLKLTGKRKISNIICEQNSFKDIIFITLDKLNYEILKKLINNKDIPNYVLLLPDDFLKTKTNTEKLVKILNNSYSKEHIYLEIEYSQFKKYNTNIQILNKYKIPLIVSNIKKQYSREIIEQTKFMILDENNIQDDNLIKIIKDKKIFTILDESNKKINYPNANLIRNKFNSKIISKEKMI